jgi:hypothetical protein
VHDAAFSGLFRRLHCHFHERQLSTLRRLMPPLFSMLAEPSRPMLYYYYADAGCFASAIMMLSPFSIPLIALLIFLHFLLLRAALMTAFYSLPLIIYVY